jgi:hypothetical protein
MGHARCLYALSCLATFGSRDSFRTPLQPVFVAGGAETRPRRRRRPRARRCRPRQRWRRRPRLGRPRGCCIVRSLQQGRPAQWRGHGGACRAAGAWQPGRRRRRTRCGAMPGYVVACREFAGLLPGCDCGFTTVGGEHAAQRGTVARVASGDRGASEAPWVGALCRISWHGMYNV